MAATPQQLCDPFEPGIITYGVDLQKVFPPPVLPKKTAHLFLIKVYVVLRLGPEGVRKEFEALRSAILANKSFCGVYVHEASELLLDDLGGYVELVCYLRQGNEQALLRLDEVAQASPRFAGSFQAGAEDLSQVRSLVEAVRSGSTLEQAASSLPVAPRAHSAPVPHDGGTGPAPPPSVAGTPDEVPAQGYIIGNDTAGKVVIRGEVGQRLQEADKRATGEE